MRLHLGTHAENPFCSFLLDANPEDVRAGAAAAILLPRHYSLPKANVVERPGSRDNLGTPRINSAWNQRSWLFSAMRESFSFLLKIIWVTCNLKCMQPLFKNTNKPPTIIFIFILLFCLGEVGGGEFRGQKCVLTGGESLTGRSGTESKKPGLLASPRLKVWLTQLLVFIEAHDAHGL